ncbi:MAG: hypothetical protein DVB29_06420 [Verrucomicrobia bacterium]|nr:MAG: hypothetical protein DVB29_06420 [Verrucomicrobiota bacterium]
MEKLTISADPSTPSASSTEKTSDEIAHNRLQSHSSSIKELFHQSYQKVVSYFIETVFTTLSSFFIATANKFSKKPSASSPDFSLVHAEKTITPAAFFSENFKSVREENIPQKKFPWSALIMIGMPTLLSVLYFGFIASDQYETTTDYIIKSQSPSYEGASPLSLIGLNGGDTAAAHDNSMLQAYVGSQQILHDLSADLNLRKIFASSEIDWFSRLKSYPDLFKRLSGQKTRRTSLHDISDEELLRYWHKMVRIVPGNAPGTSTLEVKAFTPEDAKLIADHVLILGEQLVNRVSARTVKDALRFALKEVDDAHERAIRAFDQLQELQVKVQQVDPVGYAKVRSEIQAKIESELSAIQAQTELLRKNLPEDAPGIQLAKNQVISLQSQLLKEKFKSTAADQGASATEVLNEFAKRQLESEFAAKDYLAALSALETARVNANRQSRYLEAFDLPELPDKPSYPRRWYDILSVLALSSLCWAVWSLFIAGVREHQH